MTSPFARRREPVIGGDVNPLTRLPREGGDPDQGQPTFGAPQVWAPAFAGDTDLKKYKPDACVIFA
ncbi:MAG: hypothetical protein RJA87_2669 [Pseudomonadota bacterium]|jgi:hypothetical protein